MIIKSLAIFILCSANFIIMSTKVLLPTLNIEEKMVGWINGNQNYIILLIGVLIVDHLLGTISHATKLFDFSFKKNVYGLFIKICLVCSVGFIFEGLCEMMIFKNSAIKLYTQDVLHIVVFMYPADSALKNSVILSDGRFPPRLLLDQLKEIGNMIRFIKILIMSALPEGIAEKIREEEKRIEKMKKKR